LGGQSPARLTSSQPEGISTTKVNRGEPSCTFVNEIIGLPLVRYVFPQFYDFPGDAVLELVEPGLYRKAWLANRSTP
jgi:hypothetical protein